MKNTFKIIKVPKSCLVSLVVGCLMFVNAPAQATFAVLDIFRGLEATMQSIERISEQVEETTKISQLNEEVDRWSRKSSLSPLPGDTYKSASDIKVESLPSSAIIPPQTDLDTAEKAVKSTFFVKPDEVDESAIAKVKKARLDYVLNLTKEIISYGASLRESASNDLNTLGNASSAAGGVLQEIELNTQTIKSLVLITASNVLLEMRIMELESAQMMLTLDEKLPEEKKEGKK